MNKFINSFYFGNKTYYYHDLKKVFEKYPLLRKIPNSLKILLESNIRNANENEIETIINIFIQKSYFKQIRYVPTRVILNDSFGLPLFMDFAYIRDRQNIELNPKVMIDLIVDNRLAIDEPKRNQERYSFLKWASKNFTNLSVVPPNNERYPYINLEYLSTMLCSSMKEDKIVLYPETIVGTDSHSSLINALGVLGLRLDEFDTQASMFGSIKIIDFPKVVGVEIFGTLSQGLSFNDVIENLSNKLKEFGVKGKIVEFYGNGVKNITLENRATLSTLAQEYGAICGYFGVDNETISYIEQTRGVDASIIKEYFIKQGMYENDDLLYDEYIRFNLTAIKSVAYCSRKLSEGIEIKDIPSKLKSFKKGTFAKDNDVVLAIVASSKSTTSIIQACLVAKKACSLGLSINKNVKRYFEIDSYKIKEYLEKLDLIKYLDELGFEIVLKSPNKLIERVNIDTERFNLNVVAVTSSRNFEEEIHPRVKTNWYMSPALVIAYSLKGNMNFDITKEAIYQDIYLSDIFPSSGEVNEYLSKINYSLYEDIYKNIYHGNEFWQDIKVDENRNFDFDETFTYIKPFNIYEKRAIESIEINEAKILAFLDNDINTNNIVPKGKIVPYTQVGSYLEEKGLKPDQFDIYEKRYENSEVLKRAVFTNSKLKNKIVSPKEGAYARDFQNREIISFFEFSQRAKASKKDLVIIAGSNFGSKENSFLAVKGIKALGIRVIIAKSFDKSFKNDLIKIGILPLEFIDEDIESLDLKGDEVVTIKTEDIKLNGKIEIELKNDFFTKYTFVQYRFDSNSELNYYKNNGVLSYLISK